MQGWLALWDLPPTGGDTMTWMTSAEGHGGHDTGAADGGLMPGMATEEELAQLRALSGTGFDVVYRDGVELDTIEFAP